MMAVYSGPRHPFVSRFLLGLASVPEAREALKPQLLKLRRPKHPKLLNLLVVRRESGFTHSLRVLIYRGMFPHSLLRTRTLSPRIA